MSTLKFETGYLVDQSSGQYARALKTKKLNAVQSPTRMHGEHTMTHVAGTLAQRGYFACNVCDHCEAI